MSLTNSTISHEMRNPLNSILAMCQIQEESIRQLNEFKAKIRSKLSKEEFDELQQIVDDMKSQNSTCSTSSKMLQFHVEDVLGLSQIKAKKFKKNEELFDIEQAVKEVI